MKKTEDGILAQSLGVVTIIGVGLSIASTWIAILVACILTAIYFMRYASLVALRQTSSLSHISTAFIYAVLAALVIIYVRSAQGFILPVAALPPALSNIPVAYYANDDTLTVYNKFHIRSAFIQFCIYLALIFAWSLLILSKLRLSNLAALANPWLASAVFVTVCSVIPVPPFSMDVAHWAHWVGPTAAIGQGKVPVIDVFSYYGFIPHVILYIWGSAFGFTPMSFALLLAGMAATAGLMIYVVVAQLGKSHLAAFIVVAILMLMAYDQKSWAIVTPNHSALRFHFFIAAILLLSYKFLSAIHTRRADFYALMIGILTLWSPLEGAFVIFAMVTVMVMEAIRVGREHRPQLLRHCLFYIGGIALVAIITFLFRGNVSGVVDALVAQKDFYSIFRGGYGYLPQALGPAQFASWAMMGIIAIFLVRQVSRKKENDVVLPFCVFVLIVSIPSVLQEIGRVATQPNGIWWLYLPCFVILLSRSLVDTPLTTARAIFLSTLAIVWVSSVGNPIATLVKRLDVLTVSREADVFHWAKNCDVSIAKGETCSSPLPMTLHGKFIDESQWQFAKDPFFQRMVAECKSGAQIVDTRDAFVYQFGQCSPSGRYQSFFSISSQHQNEEFLDILLDGRPVIFGNAGGYDFQQRLLDEIKEKWKARRLAPTTCNPTKANTLKFTASALSDEQFSGGILLSSRTSLLLDTDRDMLCYLKPGTRLHFAGSGERIITKTVGDTIQLSGAPLDVESDGYPNQIEIVRN